MSSVVTRSSKETQKIATLLARSITPPVVIALEGELGSGKTTFVQGFARALGIKEKVLSPTFVLMKIYRLRQATRNKRQGLRHLVHIDCYRINSPRELVDLGLKNLLKDKDAIILIEWADRIKKLLPKNSIWIKFRHGKSPHTRIISLREGKEIEEMSWEIKL